MKDFTATHKTIVIVAFLAAIVGLTIWGRDTAALIAVGTAILAGLGLSLGQQQAVKEQTNGNTTKMIEIIEAQGKLLAQMRPPPAVDDKEPLG